MKYLDSSPFSSKASNDDYRKGWDRVFGNKPKDKPKDNVKEKTDETDETHDNHK